MRSQPESSNDSGEDRVAWALCEACGHWQQDNAGCASCGWQTIVRVDPARADVGSALRFLVEAEVRSDGSWRIAALRSARLPSLAHDAELVMSPNDGAGPIRHLRATSNGAGVFPRQEAWDRFREGVTGLIDDLLKKLVQEHWPGPAVPSTGSRGPLRAFALVAVRCLVLHPDISFPDEGLPSWLHVVPFDTAASDAAAGLDDDDVVVTCGESVVGLGEGGELITVAVSAPCELLVESCAVVCESADETRVEWRFEQAAIACRDVQLRLPSIRLTADAVRELAAASQPQVQVAVRGRAAPFVGQLAVGELPAQTRIADLILDLGSTTTKWALQFRDDGRIEEHDQETEKLVRAWGIQPYRKSELVADTSGAAWSDWLAQALPALRYWVGCKHGAYLSRVVVSLPSTPNLDVESLSSAVLSKEHERLAHAVKEHLAHGGGVHLEPEHVFLARHYLDVLRVLQDCAKTYATRFEDHEQIRQAQASRQNTWNTKAAELEGYKKKKFLVQLFSRKPDGPTGDCPSVSKGLALPAAWMSDLLARHEQLDRVALLDAGGLSLDIAILEKHVLVRERSRSFNSCGGEELSLRIGRGRSGIKGTRYKAGLGQRWAKAPNSQDQAQREYLEATREFYEPELRPLVAALGKRWRRSDACVVLLTGGGSRNPHLGSLIGSLFAEAGLQPTVVDSPIIQEMLRQARSFSKPLPELESPPVTRFEQTQAWSERRERQPSARYDKFAVVGGMLATNAEADE